MYRKDIYNFVNAYTMYAEKKLIEDLEQHEPSGTVFDVPQLDILQNHLTSQGQRTHKQVVHHALRDLEKNGYIERAFFYSTTTGRHHIFFYNPVFLTNSDVKLLFQHNNPNLPNPQPIKTSLLRRLLNFFK